MPSFSEIVVLPMPRKGVGVSVIVGGVIAGVRVGGVTPVGVTVIEGKAVDGIDIVGVSVGSGFEGNSILLMI